MFAIARRPRIRTPEPPAVDIFVARQPIFDDRNRLAGYELLYRSGERNAANGFLSPDQMTTDVIVHSLLGIGLERITHGHAGYVNFTRDMLLDRQYELLDPKDMVIELLENIAVDGAVLDACERMTRAGYRLALDDFTSYDPRMEPLLRVADVVKVDVMHTPAEQLESLVERLRPFDTTLLAEKVETAAVHETCRALGFGLFQGYHFSRPEVLSKREVPVGQLAIIRLLNLLRDMDASDVVIEEAFRSDLSLSYKLLRIVNSAAHGGRGIESILHAVRLLGRDVLHRWLALLFVSSMARGSEADAELVETALVRARLCEQLAEVSGRPTASGPLFLVGLFSLLDRLMKMPIEEILARVDLAPDVRDALLGRRGPFGPALELVEAYEQGRWDVAVRAADVLGVPAARLLELYVGSLAWARERLALARR